MKTLAKLQPHLELSGLLETHSGCLQSSAPCRCRTEAPVTFLLAVVWGVLSATRGRLQAKPGVPLPCWQQGLQGRRMPLRVAAVESHRSQGYEGRKLPYNAANRGRDCPVMPMDLGHTERRRRHREFCQHQHQRPHPQREKLWQRTQAEAWGSTERALSMGSAVLC